LLERAGQQNIHCQNFFGATSFFPSSFLDARYQIFFPLEETCLLPKILKEHRAEVLTELIPMATCPKCRADVEKDEEFCHSCGAPLKAKASEPTEKESYPREREVCFGGGERHRDFSGLVSFGIFLVIVGITFAANPNMSSQFRTWGEQMSTQKTLLRPPQELIDSATLFFGLIGVSNFFLAGVRFMADKALRRVLVNVLSGVALVVFSYLTYLYGRRELAWQMVLAIEVIAVGLLVISYSLARYLFPKRLQ
jgi:hypothetical protein